MFGHIKSTPSASLNWKLITAISVLGFMGMSRGSDEGIISGVSSSKSWLQRFQVQDGSSAQSNVVSMVQLGSIPGSLLAFLVVDQLGRLRTSQICCLLWLVGNTVWITSPGSVGQVLAGRFVSGLGIGGFPVVCPTFLAEIAPATVRGAAVGAFSSSVYIAILIGYSVNYGVSLHYDDTDERIWKIPVAVNFIFAGLALMGTLAIRESPRWLLGKAREEEAIGNLCWYRGLPDDHPFIKEELEGIRTQTGMERQASELANKPGTTRLVELFSKSSNLYRLFVIGFGIQILGQWSGGGSLTIYAPKIINLVEKTSDTTLFTT
ncbi:MFS general substrate transporter [Violaceomyces palustris]|uniref:MFS general substrate transporter n=1 Tax=Violaceomyces palustris TaxID=1673888 RepID=A0ACD0NLJ5_9BASI|nr:MFS general substrate transporter [Violaceomyces palustris]